ncbi:MAG TPA: ATP synthase F0 subunit B [Candidatus Acidoferrum sp.]|nr:ATP synthase F0 subunit B [Candidatus Acidoferrum sp.]
MDILHQLGELFLQAVPTVIIVFLFYFFLRWAFFAPIEKAMAERNARIEGAKAEAARIEGVAKQELDSYNEALKKARGQVYLEQERSRQAVLDERARLLNAMRSRAKEEVDAAKKRIVADVAAAQADVERQVPELAAQIARSILERPSPRPGEATQ